MPTSCAAYGCTNRFTKGSGITFHRFPLNNELLLREWVTAIRRDLWQPTKSSYLCSKHFEESCFRYNNERRSLLPGVVPTIFDFHKEVHSSRARKQLANLPQHSSTTQEDKADRLETRSPIELEGAVSIDEENQQMVMDITELVKDYQKVWKLHMEFKSKCIILKSQLKAKEIDNKRQRGRIKNLEDAVKTLGAQLNPSDVSSCCERKTLQDREQRCDNGKLTNLCRLCASSSLCRVPLFGTLGSDWQLVDKIHTHLPIMVTKEDLLPLDVCPSCINCLNQCHELAVTCLQADARLRTMFGLEQPPDEEADPMETKFASVCKTENSWEGAEEKPQLQEMHPAQKFDMLQEQSVEMHLGGDLKKETCLVGELEAESGSVANSQMEGCSLEQPGVQMCTVKVPQQTSIYSDAKLCLEPQFQGVLPREELDNEREPQQEPKWEQQEMTVHHKPTRLKLCNTIGHTKRARSSRMSEGNLKDNDPDEPDPVAGTRKSYLCLKCNVLLKSQADFDLHTARCGEASSLPRLTDVLKLLSVRAEAGENGMVVTQTGWRCHCCDLMLSTESKWREHIGRHSLQETECDGQFLQGKDSTSQDSSSPSLVCRHCGASFPTVRAFKYHLAVHGKSSHKPYSCRTCGKRYRSISGLRSHQDVHTPGHPYLCDVCGKGFQQRGNFLNHRVVHRDRDLRCKFICPVCGNKYFNSYQLREHQRTHTDVKPYECRMCDRTFSNAAQLHQHSQVHAPGAQLRCHVCGKKFSRRSYLMLHARSHGVEPIYTCRPCGEKFSSRSAVLAHRRTHYGAGAEPRGGPVQCDLCGRLLKSARNLELHLQTHTGEKPFKCRSCNRRFLSKGSLQNHERWHTGEKPYVCRLCNRSFAWHPTLVQHMAVHEDARRFQCSLCGKRFKRFEILQNHTRSHTGERPFACRVCSKAFKQRSDRNMHEARHARHCIQCDTKFGCEDLYERHLETCCPRSALCQPRTVVPDVSVSDMVVTGTPTCHG